uniref:Ion_trans_2 domain-containing protein n=1 Tax=Ascaris lumbricoides TaxID=6252 RepID=A0A0M3IXL9_ASCLU
MLVFYFCTSFDDTESFLLVLLNVYKFFTIFQGVKADSSVDSFGVGPDVQDLLTARAQLDQLEVKESVEAQLQRISVPLSLVFFTMFAYLVAGSIIFCVWEGWTFLDSFYFCYISLTTIGLLVNEDFVQIFF